MWTPRIKTKMRVVQARNLQKASLNIWPLSSPLESAITCHWLSTKYQYRAQLTAVTQELFITMCKYSWQVTFKFVIQCWRGKAADGCFIVLLVNCSRTSPTLFPQQPAVGVPCERKSKHWLIEELPLLAGDFRFVLMLADYVEKAAVFPKLVI